jgi:hypothetical protein
MRTQNARLYPNLNVARSPGSIAPQVSVLSARVVGMAHGY